MILDANAQEAAALLDLLDKAQRAGGLNVSYWCLHWAQKVKAAEAMAARAGVKEQAKLAVVEGADA